jgi:hypothetical protein
MQTNDSQYLKLSPSCYKLKKIIHQLQFLGLHALKSVAFEFENAERRASLNNMNKRYFVLKLAIPELHFKQLESNIPQTMVNNIFMSH